MARNVKSIVLIGAGNVAWHLGHVLYDNGYTILKILSKTAESAAELASRLHTEKETFPCDIPQHADIVIVAVPDNSIKPVINNINLSSEQLIVHTSGSTPMSVFDGRFENYGVLYPFQSLTKKKKIDFNKILLCVEANTTENREMLMYVARTISEKTMFMDSQSRASLHLAAVFASNFSNHMYTLAEHILTKHGLDFNLLQPLIDETCAKIKQLSPVAGQTGPAIRNDTDTIEKHLKMLDQEPGIQHIYKILSDSILRFKNKES